MRKIKKVNESIYTRPEIEANLPLTLFNPELDKLERLHFAAERL